MAKQVLRLTKGATIGGKPSTTAPVAASGCACATTSSTAAPAPTAPAAQPVAARTVAEAPVPPDLRAAILDRRRQETDSERVDRLMGHFKSMTSPVSSAPSGARAAAATATMPSPDWTDALRAARQ